MSTETKGRAWFCKFYNKLETILGEVDSYTSQSALCLESSDSIRWESVRDGVSENPSGLEQHRNRLALPSFDSPFDPPLHQNFDVSGHVRVEEQVGDNGVNENHLSASSLPGGEIFSGGTLHYEYCDGNLSSARSCGDDEESVITVEESLISQKLSNGDSSSFPGKESVEEVGLDTLIGFVSTQSPSTRSSVSSLETVVICNDGPVIAALEIPMVGSNLNQSDAKIPNASVQDNEGCFCISLGNLDVEINGKSEFAHLDAKALFSIAFREDPSYVDENALYAMRVRTKKLRSFKRKILDALTSKRRREKEYEHLAIWFGDADMGSDLATEDSKHVEATDSKSSQVPETKASQWELL
ncbi:unnamed protein product [Cochlearia groenlandica]